ncbi:Cytochrome c oxidase assembly protein COX11, mitochondrial [Schistosoma japonicum]|nr:Cytochrome c oxidase assembly protein COX11, mitochondrial [Schistosoma japonicum]
MLFDSLNQYSSYLLKRTLFSKSGVNYTKHNAFTHKAFKRRTLLYYTLSFGIFMIGFGYGTVPLYRLYCSKTGSGTNSSLAMAKTEKIKTMKPIKDREYNIYFTADTHSAMKWKFKPLQKACFCFEEQRLNPHEKVDLPVFFYIDPEINADPWLKRCSQIVLSYTFFEAKKAKLHIPGITTPEYSSVKNPDVKTV